jgi:hypothetical protein
MTALRQQRPVDCYGIATSAFHPTSDIVGVISHVRKVPQAEQWPWEPGPAVSACVERVPSVATQKLPFGWSRSRSCTRAAHAGAALLSTKSRADFRIISSIDLRPEHLDRQLVQKSASLPGPRSSAATIRPDFLADTMDLCATCRKR